MNVTECKGSPRRPRTAVGSLALLALIALLLGTASCEKPSVKLPPSVQALMNAANCDPTCPSFVDSYRWRNQTVFVYSCSGPLCNCAVSYFDEEGERITMEPAYYFSHFTQEAKLLNAVWRCR